MDNRIAKLAKAAAASIRGATIDAQWLFGEANDLVQNSSSSESNAIWHTLVDAARALNNSGDYALGGEVFELLLEQARQRRYPKLEFDAPPDCNTNASGISIGDANPLAR